MPGIDPEEAARIDEEDALVAHTEPELVKLWRVWTTIREMLADRGYQILQDEIHMPLKDFRQRFATVDGSPNRGAMDFTLAPTAQMVEKYSDLPSAKDPNPAASLATVRVEFSPDSNVGIKQMRDFVHRIVGQNHSTGIFVCGGTITSAAMKVVPTALPSIIETFHESDLLINITRHQLVPKHVILSKAEKTALLERYRVKESQLPRIQQGDPVARYLGLRRGQVVKIIRKSETAVCARLFSKNSADQLRVDTHPIGGAYNFGAAKSLFVKHGVSVGHQRQGYQKSRLEPA